MEDRKTSLSFSFEARSALLEGREGKSTMTIRGLGSSAIVKEPAFGYH